MKHFHVLLLGLFLGSSVWAGDAGIPWVDWTPDLFAKATSEKRLVILDLEAVWCHWCHVMEEKTYSNPKVKELISKHFIAVRVDQDARPDLSRRYEDWGWPATIFFGSDGKELAKRSGNQKPEEMIELLESLIRNPVPEESSVRKPRAIPDSPFLSKDLKKTLQNRHVSQYNRQQGGWGTVHKFLYGETEEWAMRGAWKKNKDDARRARESLTKALALIDPVWGGVYQYSVDGWNEPHFEKIASIQARNLFLYSLGYTLFGEAKYRKAAENVQRYLNAFLRSPEGAYYTSQDADVIPGKHSEGYFRLNDAKRRKQGIPRIDKHLYARENGGYIQGLCALYAVTLDEKTLADAKAAARWAMDNRALDGGFRHDEKDASGPYLGDSLEMGQALLALYEVTAERTYLEAARKTGAFIQARFTHREGDKAAGYLTNLGDLAAGLNPEPSREENTALARFANRLFHYSGDKNFEKMAQTAMRFLAVPEVAQQYPTAGVLLADEELSTAPVHLTIVGAKSDPAARALFLEALSYPTSYKRVEWWDKTEGDLPHADVKYPEMKKAAAYACTDGRCSLPVFDPKGLKEQVNRLYR